MHILIAFLTALASLLYALERLGVDIGWINPWAWRRKRRWMKQYHADPALSIESPLQVVALVLTATARIDGDLSSEEKNALLNIFQEDLKQTSKEASDLLLSSSYLLNSGRQVYDRPRDVLAPSMKHFTDEQKDSALSLLHKVAQVGGGISQVQEDYIAQISSALKPSEKINAW